MESNENITECLTKATTYQMLKALQKLFAVILYHCEASNVRKLWDRFFETMSKDFKRIYKDENSIIVLETMRSINFIGNVHDLFFYYIILVSFLILYSLYGYRKLN